MKRRDFLAAAGPIALCGLTARRSCAGADEATAGQTVNRRAPLADRICLFTDHLDDFGYSYADVARMLKALKIAGPDLTVRPGGLVAPERAAEELPKAVAALRDVGLTVPMISTGLTSGNDATALGTLQTAGKLGIGYFKLGYYRYDDAMRWQSRLDVARKELQSLLAISRRAGLVAGFHNHSGPYVGGAQWDSWEVLETLDRAAIGFYFDPAQATIEGGNHAWKLGLARLAPRLVMVAIKDFVWEKTGEGWRTRWVPLGEGVVRWSEFFAMLRKIPFDGPISLHIEYDPGGASKMARFENSLAAAERDLQFLRKQLAN
jgi:sugar phosphate isomerase/epimerase